MNQLSGGLRQRFSLVAAIVNEPELVFFDEPTAGLDPDARRDLWEIVEDIRAQGATVVLTTHYMDEAERLCDRIAFLNDGRIAALDTPEALVRQLHAPYLVRVLTAGRLPLDPAPGIEVVTDEPDGDAHRLGLRVADAPAAVSMLTSIASSAGFELQDLTIEAATLDDVFLALTGRGLTD
jgi:ABC-2 type transport system ATP-binding protein